MVHEVSCSDTSRCVLKLIDEQGHVLPLSLTVRCEDRRWSVVAVGPSSGAPQFDDGAERVWFIPVAIAKLHGTIPDR